MIRPATCEGGGEARRSRWMKHSVINKEEEEDKDKEEGEENLGTSKFEAALKDLEALGRGQGTRYFLIMICVSADFDISLYCQVGGSAPAKGLGRGGGGPGRKAKKIFGRLF